MNVLNSGALLTLSVKDRGAGFPPGFNPGQIRKFSRQGGSGKGFGLGLAIVQAIAQAHQASLNIAPRTGGGAVVSLGFAIHVAGSSHD